MLQGQARSNIVRETQTLACSYQGLSRDFVSCIPGLGRSALPAGIDIIT